MTITITAFEASPDRGRGLARDMRVRWALEEVGQPYDVRLLSFAAMKEPAHLERNPFGQIPTYEEDGHVLFETGSILFHIAERHPGLLPTAPIERAHAITWMFAALGTVEQPIVEYSNAFLAGRGEPWFEARAPALREQVHARLRQLAAHLAGADWLRGDFSAADILMIHVVRRAASFLDDHPTIAAYVARGEARPAYQRAFAAQLAVFEANQAAGA
jgi:glutathione S-transferase